MVPLVIPNALRIESEFLRRRRFPPPRQYPDVYSLNFLRTAYLTLRHSSFISAKICTTHNGAFFVRDACRVLGREAMPKVMRKERQSTARARSIHTDTTRTEALN